MSIKIFPWTFDGDQISITFEYREEKNAFEDVIDRLRVRINKNPANERELQISDFEFKTTLETEVSSKYFEGIRRVLGLRIFNVLSKNSCVVIPFPNPKKVK